MVAQSGEFTCDLSLTEQATDARSATFKTTL
jgi:hypothetical protein